jgi:hypothetical protein
MVTLCHSTERVIMTDASKTVPLSQVIVTFAAKRDIEDVTKAGKLLRSSLRSNFPHLQKEYGYPGDVKENRDGNRWPPLPESLAAFIGEHGRVPAATRQSGGDAQDS